MWILCGGSALGIMAYLCPGSFVWLFGYSQQLYLIVTSAYPHTRKPTALWLWAWKAYTKSFGMVTRFFMSIEDQQTCIHSAITWDTCRLMKWKAKFSISQVFGVIVDIDRMTETVCNGSLVGKTKRRASYKSLLTKE